MHALVLYIFIEQNCNINAVNIIQYSCYVSLLFCLFVCFAIPLFALFLC